MNETRTQDQAHNRQTNSDQPGVRTTRDEDKRLETVRNLLSKAEATEFPEEAEAFFAKASELISRWAIDEAMLWDGSDRNGREVPDELQMVVHGPYVAQKAILVSGVAAAHGCRAIRISGSKGSRTEIMSIIGFPSDLRWVETLVTSLLMQLTSAMLARCPKGITSAESASWRRSFIVGYAQEVRSRLEQDRAAAAAAKAATAKGEGSDRHASAAGPRDSDGNSIALVLASRAEEVNEDFRRRFPYVRSSWASSGRSAHGHDAGRRAGREASLTRGGIGGRRALGPS